MFEQNTGTATPSIDWCSGNLMGKRVHETVKTLRQMQSLFLNRSDLDLMDLDTIVYRVQLYAPVQAGTIGGLFWGTTVISPGRIGDEYFMTHGHFHSKRECAEFYGCVEGKGMLILMDDSRRTWVEGMTPGSLHYVPGSVAHRVANVSDTPLRFVACWPSNAGHDYEIIRKSGFGARLLVRNGEPALVQSE